MKSIIVIIAIIGLFVISGCELETNGNDGQKITYETFIETCEKGIGAMEGGKVMVPFCGTPDDPDCPERESTCICSDGNEWGTYGEIISGEEFKLGCGVW